MTWEWLNNVSWIGTTLVAIGGLGATVWTARRSGQIQLAVHDRQTAENRRTLEWQEKRIAYATFLKDFQEYFDKVTTQYQLDWALTEAGRQELVDNDPRLSELWAAFDSDEERHAALKEVQQRTKDQYQVLTRREVWAIETTAATAANHARLIAPPEVRDAIGVLMEKSSTASLQEAAKQSWQGFDYFVAVVQDQKLTVEQIMNHDLTHGGEVAIGRAGG